VSRDFFLSAEDDLVRLFAGDRIYKISTGSEATTRRQEEPIEAACSPSRSRRRRRRSRSSTPDAQHTLEYDDVLNSSAR